MVRDAAPDGAGVAAFAPSDLPGSSADTSHANAAVNPAASTIIHRRIRLRR
jgi:hypothetical protein